jgi:OPT family oligopeptide transporter
MHNMPAGDGHMVIDVLGYRGIVSWSVWGGVSLMTTAALLNFGLQWRTLARALSGIGAMFKKRDEGSAEDPLERVEVPSSWFVTGVLVSGALCVAINAWAFHIAIWLGALAVVISAVLAIVACRATGETDTTPIGALGKITQLTYGLLIPQNITANLMTANVTASIASSSADLLTDLKSGYLLGANPRKQFLAQFFGVFAGTLVAVPGFFLLVPRADVLGSDKFPAPSAQVWKAVAELLGKGVHSLHSSALWAMAVGGALGIVITLLEKAFPKHRHLIPSPTGIGLAFVIPAWNSISMFIGAFVAWVLEKKRPETAETYTIPVASGLIAGESLMGVFVAVFGVVYDLFLK